MTTEREPWRWKKLGFTLKDYERLNEEQGGVCAVAGCGGKPGKRRLHVDHDHATGRVRGLLCYRCNAALDTHTTPARLRAMADYLERKEQNATH